MSYTLREAITYLCNSMSYSVPHYINYKQLPTSGYIATTVPISVG